MPLVLLIIGVGAVGVLAYLHERASIVPPVAAPPVVVAAPPIEPISQTVATAAAPIAESATAAIPVVGPAIAAAESILLGQHTARLNGAIAENQAIPAAVQAFDADLAQLVSAYNSGEVTAAQAISALMQMDLNIYNSMRNLVGQPGTSWTIESTQAIGQGINPTYSADCNKSCTAACCVYYNDLRPAIYGRNVSAGGPTAFAMARVGNNVIGAIQILQQGSGTMTVIPVSPPSDSAYGDFSRAQYSVTFKKPSAVPLSVSHLA